MTDHEGPRDPAVAALLRDLEAQEAEVETFVESLTDAQLYWRPDPNRWSIAENLVHITLPVGPYADAVDAACAAARKRGDMDLQRREPWLGERFVRSLEPPPRFRIRTAGRLEPSAPPGRPELLAAWRSSCRRFDACLRAADGVTLTGTRIVSPFFRLLRLSVSQAFRSILAHNRRHLWQAHRVAATTGFPPGEPAEPVLPVSPDTGTL